MARSVLLHLPNQETVKGELESLPKPADQFIILRNPRRPDGKPLGFLENGVDTILVSWREVLFVQLLPGSESEAPISFVRE